MSNQLTTHNDPKHRDFIAARPSELKTYLNDARDTFAALIPAHLSVDRLFGIALASWRKTPDLRKCTALSIVDSLRTAAVLGLEVNVDGEAYLIPYNDWKAKKMVCTLVPGWKGLTGIVNNTGRATVWTEAVYEGDDFKLTLGDNPSIRHEPGPNYKDESKVTWAYACGKVNGTEKPVIDAWPMPRILAHRDKHNKVKGAHYSFNNLEMYARKVPLLQVLKYMPKSITPLLAAAITASHAAEGGRNPVIENGEVIDVMSEEIESDDEPTEEQQEPKQSAAPNHTREKPKPPHPLRVRFQGAGIDEHEAILWANDKGIIACGKLEELSPAELQAMNEPQNWADLVAAMKGKKS